MSVFECRYFSYAKDPEHPEQNQDAFQVRESDGFAVIADGVTSAIFSAAWAKLLTQTILENPPNPEDQDAFMRWLLPLRRQWYESVDTTNLAWYQKPKLASGAFTTLLWCWLEPCPTPEPGDPEFTLVEVLAPKKRCFLLRGWAIGDSCLFHVRENKPATGAFDGTDLMKIFPLEKSEDFEESPNVLGSVDLGKDPYLKFQKIERIVQEGDWIVLATDAFSQWTLRSYEAGMNPDWEGFRNLSDEAFYSEIDQMRSAGEIRYDDTTLAILKIGVSAERADSASDSVPEPVSSPRLAPRPVPPKPKPQPQPAPSQPPQPQPSRPQPAPRPVPPRPVPQPQPETRSEPSQGFHYSIRRPGDPAPDAPQEPVRDTAQDARADQWIEATGQLGNRLSENVRQWKEKGSEMAENVGDQISDGMLRLGDKTHAMVESATPKVKEMMGKFFGMFRREKSEDVPQEEPEERRKPQFRKPDPNRRRFYHPPEDDTKK
ncbi:MAG: hypothetical protein Q4D98_09885 [Planctomycetia bacterium]|nr:hypothetical protein [Planctomycetia bacterium]